MENFIKSKLNADSENVVKLLNQTKEGRKNPVFYPKKTRRLTFGSNKFQPTFLCLEQDELDLEFINSNEITHLVIYGAQSENNLYNLSRLMKDENAWGGLYSIQFKEKAWEEEEYNAYLQILDIVGDSKSLGGSSVQIVFTKVKPFTLFVLEDNEPWLEDYIIRQFPKKGVFYFKVLTQHVLNRRTLYNGEVLVYNPEKRWFVSVWNGSVHVGVDRNKLVELIVVRYSELDELHAVYNHVVYFSSVTRFNLEVWRGRVKTLMKKWAQVSVLSVNRKYYKGKDSTHLEIHCTE